MGGELEGRVAQAAAVATAKAAAVVPATAGTTPTGWAVAIIRDDGSGGSLGSKADFTNDMSWLGDDGDC